MNEIPDYILYVIIFDVVVALVVLGYFIKRRRKPKQEKPLQPAIETMEGRILHRCPNPKCNALFKEPAKEITYITDPPTEKLICPKCFTPLKQLTSGKLKVGPLEILEETEETQAMIKYDLTVNPQYVAEMVDLLFRKGFRPILNLKDSEFHITITSDKELSFERLKEKGKVLKWEKV